MSVTGKQVAEQALTLATVKKNLFGKITGITPQNIPYVEGGETTSGLDCQGFLELCHRKAGFPMSYAGTNDMSRHMSSYLVPIEDCVKRFGSVPIGAPVFIQENDGNEPAKYKADGKGNFSHVYLKVASGWLMHASASTEKTVNGVTKKGWLAVKEFSDKTIPNGGPNYVGLVDGVSYDGVDYEYAQASAASETAETNSGAAKFSTRYSKFRWREDDMGDGVRAVQTALNLAGASPQLQVDGRFGPITTSAVIAFQSLRGLKADGVVGEYTWGELLKVINGQ